MHSSLTSVAAFVALATIPLVTAHGYVSGVVAGGKWYAGASPNWIYASTKPPQAGWYSKNQDLGFVAPSAYTTGDITCGIAATPGSTYIPVKAGSSIDLQWTVWPESHHGPVITYLARCHGPCTSTDKNTLNFFKIDEKGLDDGSVAPGKWASDDLIANNNTWKVTIPSDIAGDFVLRHEIIALHSAGNQDGAQNYPNCLNFQISGSGTARPCKSGADCRHGTELYKATDPGILINIYQALTSYKIPGPKLWSGASAKVKRIARKFIA